MNTRRTVTNYKLYVTGGILCLLLLICSTCIKEKETEQSYPRVSTGQVTNINVNGVTFNGSFLQAGKSEITDHGFVFETGIAPTVQSGEKISLGSSSGNGSFTATARFGLKAGQIYYVSAYAQNKDKIFYAEPVSFVSKGGAAPEILAIVPPQGIKGDTVVIRGKYFSQQRHNNTVKFGEQEASVISASDTAIAVSVPPSNGREFADVLVTTAGQTAQKISGFKYLSPVITGLSPRQGVIGDTITVTGKYLRYDMDAIAVFFGEQTAKILQVENIKKIAPQKKELTSEL